MAGGACPAFRRRYDSKRKPPKNLKNKSRFFILEQVARIIASSVSEEKECVSLMDALRVPLKTIHERVGHALPGSFTLDVYGHTLDWTANEDAAQGLGNEIVRAVAKGKSNLDSGPLTAHQKKNFQTHDLEVLQAA